MQALTPEMPPYQAAQRFWTALLIQRWGICRPKIRLANGDETANGIAKAAWWTFFMLLLGAIAAGGGANVGAQRETAVRDDTVAY